jgi:hypothetical protein
MDELPERLAVCVVYLSPHDNVVSVAMPKAVTECEEAKEAMGDIAAKVVAYAVRRGCDLEQIIAAVKEDQTAGFSNVTEDRNTGMKVTIG